MSSKSKAEALEKFLRFHSGYLHPDICIAHSDERGYYYRARSSIEAKSTIASAPHSVTLSYLNALVDDEYPVFRERRHLFTVEAIGFFYLMIQYINRNNSFWKPYLDTLPTPEDDLTQPLFFHTPDDRAWLEGTDVWHTVSARKEIYERYYQDGIAILANAGVDTQPYTWHLFKWSTMIFASRSFTSLSLLSTGSKYRTAYKSGPDGRRQAVLLDMSGSPPEDQDFSVLFPGLDAANHSHEARVDWTFEPGVFSIRSNDPIEAGAEVLNNYGPKGNGELLIGYGFCIPNNPYDTVAVSPKAPSLGLQRKLKEVQPGYFNTDDGSWATEKATFRIELPKLNLDQPLQIFHQLPEPLLELLLYILRDERELPFHFVSQPLESLLDPDSEERRYLPHIARMLEKFLTIKISNLLDDPPLRNPLDRKFAVPSNKKQRHAAIYRQGQVDIMEKVRYGLQNYIRSITVLSLDLGGVSLPDGPCIAPLESCIEALLVSGSLDVVFLKGIEASANTQDLEQLRRAGWENDVWVLLLCYFLLPMHHQQKWEAEDTWVKFIVPEYVDIHQAATGSASGCTEDELAQAESLMEIVSTAAEVYPNSLWADATWSPHFIANVGGRIFQHESFIIMIKGGEDARLCMYLHSYN